MHRGSNTNTHYLPRAKKLMTHCSTEMTCRCFSILDLQGQSARGTSCRAERMLEPVPGDKKKRQGEFDQSSPVDY